MLAAALVGRELRQNPLLVGSERPAHQIRPYRNRADPARAVHVVRAHGGDASVIVGQHQRVAVNRAQERGYSIT